VRTISIATVSGLLLAAGALAGCGAGSTTTPLADAGAAVALESPVLHGARSIPRNYTCDGKDVSLPLQWGAVPAETKELAVMILAVDLPRPSEGKEVVNVVAQWGVLGLAPTLRRLASGTLPPGALVGLNPRGRPRYSICPAKGTHQSYLITVFTLPRRLEAHPGFTDQALFTTLTNARVPYGELTATYSRR
jgi:phosphatidylethanolamine-binding protein (PEBP) family uncharacterized protein